MSADVGGLDGLGLNYTLKIEFEVIFLGVKQIVVKNKCEKILVPKNVIVQKSSSHFQTLALVGLVGE